MAKKAILDVLENTIGRYVLNLDAQSLNVAVWSGKIELNSLELDTYSINTELDRQAEESPNLAVPFRVIGGHFDSLQVDVPWTKISSKPVVFRAKGLKVIVAPHNNSTTTSNVCHSSNTSETEKKKKNPRQRAIDEAQDARKRTNAIRDLADDDDSGEQSSFLGRLVIRIVENLQVDIENIHISQKGCGASAGIILESLSLYTTDEKGERTFVDRSSGKESFLHKALRISGFGVYMDEINENLDSKNYSKIKSTAEDRKRKHSYILSPLSFQAKLRQSSGVKCIEFPKYLVTSELSQMSIQLSRTQLELANRIAKIIQPAQGIYPIFPEYRPTVRLRKGTAKLWWKYAVRCIGRLTRRTSWTEFFIAYKKRQKYISFYKQYEYGGKCSWIKSISNRDKLILKSIELDTSISVMGIMNWRNIADAQVKKEEQKYESARAKLANPKISGYRAFFRSSESDFAQENDLDTIPISLSLDEMKELEEINMNQISTSVLSSDSKLYDIKFSLQSFSVDLQKKNLTPVARFEMGQMITTFRANNDGAFNFAFTLSSLQVDDMVTHMTLFPSIVQSLQSPSSSSFKHAFEFQSKKAKEGDQDIVVKLVAFEVVASPQILKEVKTFFTLHQTTNEYEVNANPLLEQSVGGTADLFYDAIEGTAVDFNSTSLINDTAAAAAKATTKMSEKMSNALSEAWNQKKVRKRTWTMNCNIHAPIIVVPQNVKDPYGTVFVFNMGNLHVKLGNNPTSKDVEKWFETRMERQKFLTDVDHWSLEMRNLTFLIGKAGNMDWKANAGPKLLSKSSQAIIEPLSISLFVGIESTVTEYPLTCVYGVLPSISVQITLQQVTRFLSVLSTWHSIVKELTSDGQPSSSHEKSSTYLAGDVIYEEPERENPTSKSIITSSTKTKSKTRDKVKSNLKTRLSKLRNATTAKEWFHVSIALRRLSTNFETDDTGGLEAHLVSVVMSSTNRVDDSSSIRICMGWFWILDRLKSDFPRQQRLLAHSSLPQSAMSYAINEKYDIMNDLVAHGAFEKNYAGSNDLADISIIKKTYEKSEQNEVNNDEMLELDTFINAAFSSLHINWNPQAIKMLIGVQSKISTTISMSTKERSSIYNSHLRQREDIKAKTFATKDQSRSLCTTIKATMTKLELSLNSAKDDMPLFVLTMANSKLNTLSNDIGDGNIEASFVVGNIHIQTPTGRTHKGYNTILGLAPNQSSSLLSVKYTKGTESIASSNLSDADKKIYETYAEVELSPMRIIYIQAQIMALVEFVTEGVLGAMAAQVASSAKAAAIEVVKATHGQQLYQIKASGIDFVIPQAANLEKNLVLHAGAFVVWYRTLPEDGGGEAKISLGNVLVESNNNVKIVAYPIRMSIDVKLPPFDAPTIEDRAMRISVNFSKAAFLLSHDQYAQIMYTLSTNIGEGDSFLRPEVDIYGHDNNKINTKDVKNQKSNSNEGGNVTHAGVSAVYIEKRMYLTFNFVEMAIEFGGENKFDPIILSLSAVQTNVSIKFLPDKEKMVIDATLHNLEVEDRRLISINRHFRSLMSQVEGQSRDVFHLIYESGYDGSSSLEVVVGSPQVVVLPDIINEAIQFVSIEPIKNSSNASNNQIESVDDKEIIEIGGNIDESKDVIEGLDLLDATSIEPLTTKYSLKTSNCRLVLVDMGNETMTDRFSYPKSSLEEVKELTEAIVFQGKVEVGMTFATKSSENSVAENKIQFQAEQMQMYTAEGHNLISPAQILEPVNTAVFLTKTVMEDGNEDIELKAVSLSPIDMTFSMRNAALLNAILSSISDSLLTSGSHENAEAPAQLSEEEAQQLEKLSSALNKEDGWESDETPVGRELNSMPSISSGIAYLNESEAKKVTRINATVPAIVITIINDLQGLDQALFKIIARNVVSGVEIKVPISKGTNNVSSKSNLKFDAHLNASLLADYFDISTNLWAKLLKIPWELTISAKRSQRNRFKSDRLTSMLDIESHPCYISFSEQFLVGIGAAKQMWSMYSAATTNASSEMNKNSTNLTIRKNKKDLAIRKSLAANAARALVTTMPYGIINHTGLTVEFVLNNGEQNELEERQSCSTGSIKYFRFDCPKVVGVGGKRVYGQDVKHPRTMDLFVGGSKIHFPHIDAEVNRPRDAYPLEGGQFIFAEFVNTGKATILHLSSHIHVYNCTHIPFSIALQNGESINDVGVCHGKARSKFTGRKRKKLSSRGSKHHDGMMSTKYPSSLGIPTDLLHNFITNMEGISDETVLDLLFCPHVSDKEFNYERDTPPRASMSLVGNKRGAFRWGALSLPSINKLVQIGTSSKPVASIEVLCSMPNDEIHFRRVGNSMHKNQSDSMCIQLCIKITLVNEAHPYIEVFIKPRSIIENKLPVSIFVRTPMPHTFSPPNEVGICSHCDFDLHDHVTHRVDPQQSIEIFTPGASIAVTVMCADGPIAGGVTGWCEGIVDIPLGINRCLIEPIRCLFPFVGREGDFVTEAGSEFYIMESGNILTEKNASEADQNDELSEQGPGDSIRTIFITVQNFIVDHTGNILFEPKVENTVDFRIGKSSRNVPEKIFLPWSAFSSMQKGRRLTLLPLSSKPIHLVELTIKGNDGLRRSLPFKVDDVAICEGGAESSTIMWEMNLGSGYFAYRKLRPFGQSEVHIIPEFVAFNGSFENTIVIKQPQSNHISLGPHEIAPLARYHLKKLIIMIEILDLAGSTAPIQVDTLGMRICVVKSNATGTPLGSIAIQTVVGGKDSRLVIKIGAVTFGGKERLSEKASRNQEARSFLIDDFLRFRVRWTELKISLSDTQLLKDFYANLEAKKDNQVVTSSKKEDLAVIEIIFYRFTVDFQRIFKEEESASMNIQSPERSQLAVVVHNMRILDCVNSQRPVVFDGFTEQSVFDLCVRFRGPINAELIKVELLDVTVAYKKKTQSNAIILDASEAFIWRLIHVVNRIRTAIADLAGQEMVLDWNDKEGEFEVSIIETSGEDYLDENEEVSYQPPQSDKLFDIKTARVSPIHIVFSFQRQPQSSRYYKNASSSPAAKLMNYFTHRLTFTIQNASLKFPGYITRNMKGPLDRVIESFTTFYISRVKMQFMALMTAVSLQDWKYLTNRVDGNDDFVEGDVLRLTGNMAGRSVGYVLKKFGEGIGDSVSNFSSSIGDEFEKTTSMIGAGAVGVRVNSLVSGVGVGVGSTVKSVGFGASNIVKGAGRGVGQIAGGLGGGVQQAAKGNFKEGALLIGNGVGQGLETTVTGVADGVINVGQGLFSGVKSIGIGLGGVITGKKPPKEQNPFKRSDSKNLR